MNCLKAILALECDKFIRVTLSLSLQ